MSKDHQGTADRMLMLLGVLQVRMLVWGRRGGGTEKKVGVPGYHTRRTAFDVERFLSSGPGPNYKKTCQSKECCIYPKSDEK